MTVVADTVALNIVFEGLVNNNEKAMASSKKAYWYPTPD